MSSSEPSRLQLLTLWLQQKFNLIYEPELIPITGDASFRRYFRWNHSGTSYIVADSPPETQKNEEFVEIAQYLQVLGLITPQVVAVDLDDGFLCLSDLGNQPLEDVLAEGEFEYAWSLAHPILQSLVQAPVEKLSLETFDRDFCLRELDIFYQWLVKAYLKLDWDDSQLEIWRASCEYLVSHITSQPQVFMHRDFHCRNLLALDDERGLGVIDFQDAVAGPVTYDLVSLLKDCYIRWPSDIKDLALKSFYQHLSDGVLKGVEFTSFSLWFELTGMQRHLKAAGIFARLYIRDGKSGYLPALPLTLSYIHEVALKDPNLDTLVPMLEQVIEAVNQK